MKSILGTTEEAIEGKGFPRGSDGKESTCKAGDSARQVQTLSQEDPLEKEMATHSSVLPWRIPWTEGPGRLQSRVLQRLTRPETNTHRGKKKIHRLHFLQILMEF